MRERIAWLDIAKAICIILVILMHSTFGVEKAAGETGWLNWLAEFSMPFRMPDFFLIAGVFLAARIDQPWRSYLDRRVLHYLYLYVLWLTINFAIKAPAFAAEAGWDGVARDYLLAFIDPWGALWFIYHLALFFLVTRLLRAVPWPVVWLAAAALEIAHLETGWMLPDQFAARFVYFYTGYVFARHVLRLGEAMDARPLLALAGLLVWAPINGALVASGHAVLPFVSLALGFAGAWAVVAAAVLLHRTPLAAPAGWFGARSLPIYLAFFLPMAATRTVLLKLGIIDDVGTISLLVTIAALVGPVILYELTRLSGWGRF
ncbi:MAG TPA: acyltransferase family protein, partial [Afifellaceae bacterium]|nr:acyltransferase family protein [Afifellaceae bacterium]